MRRIVVILSSLLLLAACSTEYPFEDEVKEVLEEYYGETVRQNCTFSFEMYLRVYRKPEFSRLRDGKICDGDFKIRNVEVFTNDSIHVDFQISYKANRRFTRDFFRAWDDLVKRYETLDSLKIPDPRYGYVWTYTDPYDQDIFVRKPDEPGGIFSTPRWERLKLTKNWLQNLSENRTVYSDPYSVVIVKDEVWMIIEEKSADE